ncbi:MAG: RsmE family RNA methyltransferase [Bacteroidia bacterium]
MQVFIVESISGKNSSLSGEEARHCLKVLRHQPGDEIHVTDGNGSMYLARIQNTSASGVSLQILQELPGYGESPVNVRLAVSFLRLKDRFEWLMEKAVELGVTEIYPLVCARTDKFKGKIKEDRLGKIVLTALKQSARSRLPILHPPSSVEDFVQLPSDGIRILAWCETKDRIQLLDQEIRDASSVTLMIGPEGDFTEEEVTAARNHNFSIVSLGQTRLRTETAAIYGLSILKMLRE